VFATEKFLQILLVERLHAHNIDLPDFCGLPFVDSEVDRHTITLKRRNRCRDRDSILAPRQILSLQLLLSFFKHAAVEGTRDGKPRFLEPFGQLILVKFLKTNKINLGNSRSFFNCDNDDACINLNTHVFEKTRRKKRLNGLCRLVIGHGFTNFDREIAENGSGFDTLDTIDTNILDRKWFKSGSPGNKKRGNQTRKQVFLHKFSRKSID